MNNFCPDYVGLWKSETNFRLFCMITKNEDGTGKIFERSKGGILTAKATELSGVGSEKIFFIKEYDSPNGDLFRGPIKYEGKRNRKSGLIEGDWEALNIEKKLVGGKFYLVEPCEETIGKLGKILLELEYRKLFKDISELQKESPYVLII
ncbi:hypothetical protein J4481_02315 [Candidatus Pacearchaeota archaeon]|nr:hypothetical protein [Candidatus Pacearchaeota archaeon]